MQGSLFPGDSPAEVEAPKVTHKERVVLEVEIMTPPFRRMSRKGHEYLEFSARMTGRPWDTLGVMVFGDELRKLEKEAVGAKVTISGRFDERDPKKFFVRGVSREGDKGPGFSHRADMVRAYGSQREYEKSQRVLREGMERAGYVPFWTPIEHDWAKRQKIGTTEWVPKKYCVKVGDNWLRKIDYIEEKLGAAEFKRRIMEAFFPGAGGGSAVRELFEGLQTRKPVTKAIWLEFLDKIIVELSLKQTALIWTD